LKRNEESFRKLWDNIHVIVVPEGEEREKETKKNIPRDNSCKRPSHGKGTTHLNPGSTTSTI